MMKRTAALVLAAALAASLVLPAAAADESTQDARLAQVTQAVKDTLDLDTSEYSSFYGECYDQTLVSQWSLYWEGSTGTLSIDALEDGTITGYYLSQEEAGSAGLPSYPSGDPAQAKETAQAFLAKVLSPGLESVQLEESSGSDRLGRNQYRFSGNILFHGLPSPLNCSITVDGGSGQVTNFHRDVSYGTYMGDVPSATPAVTAQAAAQSLKSSLSLKLEYVLPEDGGTQAVLRYVPDSRDEYYVDAQTGALVNLTELEASMGGMGMGGGSSSEDSAAGTPENGLSQAELADAVDVTRQTIISLEGGRYNASLLLAHRIARYFGLTIEEVFLFEEETV